MKKFSQTLRAAQESWADDLYSLESRCAIKFRSMDLKPGLTLLKKATTKKKAIQTYRKNQVILTSRSLQWFPSGFTSQPKSQSSFLFGLVRWPGCLGRRCQRDAVPMWRIRGTDQHWLKVKSQRMILTSPLPASLSSSLGFLAGRHNTATSPLRTTLTLPPISLSRTLSPSLYIHPIPSVPLSPPLEGRMCESVREEVLQSADKALVGC